MNRAKATAGSAVVAFVGGDPGVPVMRQQGASSSADAGQWTAAERSGVRPSSDDTFTIALHDGGREL
jgi:hypothetical protein